MNLVTERRIAAPRERVWQALSEPSSVSRLMPGGGQLRPTSERDLAFVLSGFGGHAHLLEREPPRHLHVAFEGEAEHGGFARGDARFELAEDGAATRLRASVEGHGGGQPEGSGEAEARRLFDGFLDALVAECGGPAGEPDAPAVPARSGPIADLLAAVPAAPLGFPLVAWIGGVVYLGIFVLIFSSYIL